MAVRLTAVRRLFSPPPVQSFHPDAKIFDLPHSGHAAKPLQGLDMRKVHDYPWVNVFTTRVKTFGGYQTGGQGLPSVHAMTREEIAEFFTLKEYWKHYTVKQIAWSLWNGPVRWVAMMKISFLAAFSAVAGFMFWINRYEPMEVVMDADEWFENPKWHMYGPELNHHAYEQYLEARRAKKWRGVDVNPVDYIPLEYRSKNQLEGHDH